MESGTSEFAAVMTRLERLEKQNRRIRQMGALTLLLIGSVFLMGQATGKRSLEANEFILRDASGKVRAKLFIDQDGPQFALFGTDGKQNVELSGSDGVPKLSFLDGDKVIVELGGGIEPSHLYLRRWDGSDSIKLTGALLPLPAKRGTPLPPGAITPGLSFYGANDKITVGLSEDWLGAGSLSLYGRNGEGPLVSLDSDFLETGPQLLLSGKNKGEATRMSATSIELSDKEGFEAKIGVAGLVTPRTGETHTTSAASVVLLDKDKTVIWKAP
jgi:hypothetical protein